MYDYIISKPPLDEDTLAHYGVLGMKWGHRKLDRQLSRVNKAHSKNKKKSIEPNMVNNPSK